MLWTRSDFVDSERIGGRRIVVGHTPKSLDYIKESLTTKIIRIDNGCVMGTGSPGQGSLVALQLETDDLFVQENTEDGPAG